MRTSEKNIFSRSLSVILSAGLCFFLFLPLNTFAEGPKTQCSLTSTPRITYLNKKQNVFGSFNNLKFSLIETHEWLSKFLAEESEHLAIITGSQLIQSDLALLVEEMITLGLEFNMNLNQFDEKDGGMFTRLQLLVDRSLALKIELDKLASLFNKENAEQDATSMHQMAQKVSESSKVLEALVTDIFECRNALMPNLNSLLNDITIPTRRTYNNIILIDVKVSADNKPDRNYILMNALGENIETVEVKTKTKLDIIASYYQQNELKKGDRELRSLLHDLRLGKGVYLANTLINYLVRKSFSQNNSEDNFEILRSKDLYDRVKNKKDYLSRLQDMLSKCQKSLTCDKDERAALENEFKNHRESLVTLYARFQEQYLKMFQMYEGNRNLVPNYLRLHTLVKRRIQKFWLWPF